MKQLPKGLRPSRVPEKVWDRLRMRASVEGDRVEVVMDSYSEAWAVLTTEELGSAANVAELVAQRIERYYLMAHKPELLVC